MIIHDIEAAAHNPLQEQIADVLCARILNNDRGFFRVATAYYLSTVASAMHAEIDTKIFKTIPVNLYAIALATSGFGKGHSRGILENELLGGFRQRFKENTMPTIADQAIWNHAVNESIKSGKSEDHEKQLLDKYYASLGDPYYSIDSGSGPAIKQQRDIILLTGIGSLNLQMDEIGLNLGDNKEAMAVYLELFDKGLTGRKATKNTSESTRARDFHGATPANALLIGEPFKLLDGDKMEDTFFGFLQTGYARRCFFAWGNKSEDTETLDKSELYDRLTSITDTNTVSQLNHHFAGLADPGKHKWCMDMDRQVGEAFLEYRIYCEELAENMSKYEDIRRTEMMHRYFKALKLAGTYAFCEESSEVTLDHALQAMKLTEESGESFNKLLDREKPEEKLARYIADYDGELTHTDIAGKLKFFDTADARQNRLMRDARAWGYKNHIIIRTTFADGIELFEGDSLKETNLDEMVVSYSDHVAYNYEGVHGPWKDLHQLTQAPGIHWCSHHFLNNHRAKENLIPPFNMIVLDVDGTLPLETAHELMKDFTFMTYTTKRHTAETNRYRIIIPMNYVLELNADDYKLFMENVIESLPFETDHDAAKDVARKWQSHAGFYHYNEGELFDVLNFIPRTSRNEEHRKQMKELQSLDNLERWFAQRMAVGNRNDSMIKYALALVDSGMSYLEVEQSVLGFNSRLGASSLTDDELKSTVLVTVAKKVHGAP